MAVQKSKKSRSKRGMRRANDRFKARTLATDPTTGETHIRHHVTANGYYRGKLVIKLHQKAEKQEKAEKQD
jgi:large subunit ribosomal protein L32